LITEFDTFLDSADNPSGRKIVFQSLSIRQILWFNPSSYNSGIVLLCTIVLLAFSSVPSVELILAKSKYFPLITGIGTSKKATPSTLY